MAEQRGRPRKDVGQALANGAGGELVPSKGGTLQSLLNSDSYKTRFKEVLGTRAAAFGSSIISAVNTNPKLKLCDPQSIIQAAMIAASMDLPINSSLGFAYLVPYSDKVQFQAGWRAFVQLAMRTGQYQTMNVAEVYDGELVKENRITGDILFDETKKKSNNIIGYVAYFRLTNGFEKYLYMTKQAIETHGRRYSKSYDSGQWKQNFDAMAKKTVLKMLLSKYGILSVDMQQIIRSDQAVIDAEGKEEYIDVPEKEDIKPETITPAKGLTDLEKKLLAEKTADEKKMENIGNEIFEPKGGN